jgi:N-acetylmuramoyl-L-alanine amidase
MATRIYIDQGHNPVNPNAGAEGSGYREQDLVYEIGVLLSEILEENGFERLPDWKDALGRYLKELGE